MAKRIKSYDAPHKGLRNALSKLSLLAGNTNYSEKKEVSELYHLGQDVFTILTIHAADENEVPLAALETRCPGCSKHDSEDHELIEKKQIKLEDLLSKIHGHSQSGEDIGEDGSEFYLSLSEFQGRYLEHISEEERVTQILLWKHFTDEELAEHRKRIMANLSPQSLLLWLKFILPALSHPERVEFLTGFKKSASFSLFQAGMDVIEQALNEREFKLVKLALADV